MDRLVSNDYAVTIAAAKNLYPPNLHKFIACDFLTGTDPIFAGLHDHVDASYGRTLRNTAHCAYEMHQMIRPKSQRRVTVVLPVPETVDTVVHELAHVMHQAIGWMRTTTDVSWYAETNRYESFAEAVSSWLVPGYAPRRDVEIEKALLAL